MQTLTHDDPSHYFTSEAIMTALEQSDVDTAGRSRVDVVLSCYTQSSWHPGSTKSTARRIAGPIVLRYVQWPDGGVDVAETSGAELQRVR